MLNKEHLARRRYFEEPRWDIIGLIPNGPHRVLQVGCGCGATLLKLMELGKAREIFGIEINQDVASEAPPELDVHVQDAERVEAPYPPKYFDYIIFADVLEHFSDPWSVVRKYRDLLKLGGSMISSVPNIRFYQVLLDLILFDKFEYQEYGILDDTHLRFFTKKEVKKLFQNEDMVIQEVSANVYIPVWKRRIKSTLFKKIAQKLPGSAFFTLQYIIKTKKIS
jgi:2-polyprenyl-3-methyl-5-hydroxy-6-metoxy-1,4-benzoquinol methylase